MATEKKRNIFQELLTRVSQGIQAGATRIAVGATPARNLITSVGREVVNQVRPLGISLGQTVAHNLPSTKRQIQASRDQIIQSQRNLIARAAVEKNPETKRRLLKLAQESGKVAAENITKTTPTYTPREIATSGLQTGGLAIGGPKVFTGSGAFTTLISGVLSGLANKIGGGSFKEGAARGVAYTPHLLAVTRATDPLLYRVIPKGGAVVPKVSAAVANVAQGKLIDVVSGRPTTPESIALDIVTGAVGGKGAFRPMSGAKLKFTMDRSTFDDLIEAEEVLRNPNDYIDKLKTFPTPDTREKAISSAVKVADETIERLAAKYLPDRVLEKVAGDRGKTIKALVDLSTSNRLANVPTASFVQGTKRTRAKISDLQEKISQVIEEVTAKAETAKSVRDLFSESAIKDFNAIKRLSRVGKYAEGDIMTYRTNYPKLTERSVEAVREVRPDIKTDEEALSFITGLPTKAETKITRPPEVGQLTQLKKVAGIEQRGIREGRRLENQALAREKSAAFAEKQVKSAEVERLRVENERFNREIGESGVNARAAATQKEYIENFRKEVAPLNMKGKEVLEKDTRRLSHLLTYNDTLRRMGYRSEEVKNIGFMEAERIIRENEAPKPRFDTLDSNVSRDLKETDKALGDVSKLQTPVEKKVSILDLFRTPDRVLSKMGLGREARFLRHQYERYLTEVPVEINKITDWSKRVDPGRKEVLFRYLDGQKENLSIQELGVAREIKSYLKGWADRLHLPADKQISNYMTHIFERDFIKKEFDEDLAKLIAERQPGSVYDPFLQKRLGMYGYIEDPWRALDAYVKRAVRKVNMDPALEQLKHASKDLELSQAKFVKDYTERINMRPTEMDNLIDNFVKSTPIGYKLGQRPIAAVTQATRQAVYRGTLGLNVGTAVKNLTQGANTYAKLGEKYTIVGYVKALKDIAFKSGELEDVGVLRDRFIQDRQIASVKKFWEYADKGLFVFFDTAERINRGAAYFGAKARALDRGASEEVAKQIGKDMSRDTQFTFGSVDTPLILQSDIAKSLLQFQSYSIKQAEFLGEMVKNKEYGGIIRWLGANIAMLALVGDAIGMDFKDLIPSVKVGGTPSMTLLSGAGQILLGNETEKEKGWENVKKGIVAHIPAGTQAKKTIQGFTANIKGGIFNPGGQLKYPVGKDFGNQLFNAVFGPGRGEGATFYFDNQLSPLGDTDTRIWQAAVQNGQDPYYAWATIYKKRIAEGLTSKVSGIVRDPTLTYEERKQEAQKVIDEGKSLIEKLSRFSSVEDVLQKVPEIPAPTPAPTSLKEKPVNRKIAFSGNYGVKLRKGVGKPTLKKRVLKVKRSAASRPHTSQKIRIAKVPEVKYERRFVIA